MPPLPAQDPGSSTRTPPFGRSVWVIPVILLVAACLPWLFGGRWGVDTGWYAGISLQAYNEGDFWSLRAGDRPFFNKPPLAFWVHGAFMKVLGADLWVIRLPGVIAAAGCVALTALIARRLSGPGTGLLAGVAMATTAEFFRLTDRFRLDFLLLLFLLLAVWLVVIGFQRGRGRLVLLSGVPIGLALLVKPILALYAFPVLGLWLVLAGRGRLAWWLIPAAAASLLVAGPWHLSMVATHGSAFADEYFGRQSFERARGTLFGAEPWWYYLGYLGRNYWPWMLGLALCLVQFYRRPALARRPGLLLAIIWAGAWLAALSLFADKKKQYLLPVYPALSWMAASAVARAAPGLAMPRARHAMATITAAALLVSVLVTAFVIPRTRRPMAPEWEDLYAFLREQGVREVWNGGIYYTDAGMIYVRTGMWPRNTELPGNKRRDPPPGALVLYDTENRAPPGGDELFRSGKLVAVRTPAGDPADAAR